MGIYSSRILNELKINGQERNTDNPDEVPDDTQDPEEENNDYSHSTEGEPTDDTEPTPPEEEPIEEPAPEGENNEEEPTTDYDHTTEDEPSPEEDTPSDSSDDGDYDIPVDAKTNTDGAEDDTQDPEEENNDYNTDGEDTSNDTDEVDDTTEPTDDTTSDYSMDDTEGGDETTQDPDAVDTGTEGGDSELQQMEKQLLGDLTDVQMDLKNRELKQQYLEVYTTTSNILLRADKISKSEENIKPLEFISKKLAELKDLVYFYITNTYKTKTYIENSINYEQYLATLNTISKIFKAMKPKDQEKSK